MSKYIYGLAIALVLGASCAIADPGGEGNNTGCNGVGNPNSPCAGQGGNGGNGGQGGAGGSANQQQQQGQVQGQAQGQVSINENTNQSSSSSTANSAAVSGSNSNSNSYSGGNSLRSNVDVAIGGPDVRNSATGGRAKATGGNAAGGDSSGQSTAIEVDASDRSYTKIEGDDYSAASAAAVFVGACQTGMSGQVEGGGFSVVNPDAFCDHINAAEAAYNAWQRAMINEPDICTEIEYGQVVDGEDVIVEWMETCGWSKNAQFYYDSYNENMKDALDMVDDTEVVAKTDRWFGFLVRPVAVIAALILLI